MKLKKYKKKLKMPSKKNLVKKTNSTLEFT